MELRVGGGGAAPHSKLQRAKIFKSRIGLPQATAEWVASSGMAPLAVMIPLLIALFLLGCMMDSLSMILLFIPFF